MKIRYAGVAKYKSIGGQRLTLGTVVVEGSKQYEMGERALGHFDRMTAELVKDVQHWNVEVMSATHLETVGA